mmetsp:Transcript_25362/g.35730  ORF Transcript_25362/g.35730 Transcript_25362/m.35730 type:complete len:239 (-) Transcript_25362:27-743(-)
MKQLAFSRSPLSTSCSLTSRWMERKMEQKEKKKMKTWVTPTTTTTMMTTTAARKQQQRQKKIVVTFSEYKRISNMLVLYIRQQEEADSNFHGFTRDQLVSWYLSEMESELQEAGASLKASKLCRLIIARLADTDRILIGDETKGLDSRKLTVHPNYNVEEGNTANLDSTDAETSAQETDLSESEADSIVSSVRAGRSPSRKAAAPAPASPATPTPPAEGASTPTSASRTRSSGRLSRK